MIPDALSDPRFADNPLVVSGPRIRFYAGLPVHGVDGFRVGALCLMDRQPRSLSPEDLVLLSDLAGMIDREFALIAQASTDPLTSLANRTGFTEVAVHVLALCKRIASPAVAIGIDLDHFKPIIDRHGHEAGDDALRLFANLLFDNSRTSDVVARLGGDEFAVLCSGATSAEVGVCLGRLRSAFEASALVRRHPGLSWSAGSADFDPASDATIEDLLRTADTRMYLAKSGAKRRLSGVP